MFDRKPQHTAQSRRRSPALVVCAALVTGALVAMFTAMALASSSTPTVGSATNVGFGEKIVVNTHGQTLYALSPETTHHLLCKSSECLKFWPPLTVRSSKTKLKDGAGVHGHLGILRRAKGVLQVTLGGLPLYRYSGDSAKGTTNGENLKSFGGTWHVVSAGTSATPVPVPAMTEATETTPSPPPPPTTSTPATTPSPSPTPTTSTPSTTSTPGPYGY